MNPKILESLKLLHQLQAVVVKPYQLPDQSQLLRMYNIPGFHNLVTKEVSEFLPETACFADFELLTSSVK